MRPLRPCIAMIAVASMLAGPATAQQTPAATSPQATVREPEALAALERMSTYLRSLNSFTVRGQATNEEVLTTGQTLQYGGRIEIMAAPPTRLRINIISDRESREIFYDGRQVTIRAPRMDYYAVFDAPATIGEMLRRANDEYGLEIPLADLFTIGNDPQLLSRIQGGFLVGTAEIDGVLCDHFAFRQANVDWEIWIAQGDEPLPRRLVITTTDDDARPQYSANLAWTLNPTLSAGTFTYRPGPDARRITMATTR